MFDKKSASTATAIVQNDTFERFARAGYVVSGLLHLTIGYLAIRIALGSSVGDADQSGALWVATVAFLVMALWRLVETAVGRSTDPKSQRAASEVLDRAKAFALAVVYFALAYSTFGFARGAGKSTGEQNSGISARLMHTGAGTVALIAVGVVIVAVGGYHIYKGATRKFLDDLKGKSSDLVRRLGTVGYVAKGLAIAGAGVLVIVAVSRSDPNNATGIDGALKTLGAQPYGAAMLIAAGLGIITYGLYSFAMARYTKM
jgi:predicted transcriptional regulator with HTH domain